MRDVYLDYNATTPVRDEVRERIAQVLADGFGNPSSTHFAGRKARAYLDEARETLSGLIGSRPSEIVFTSGGTEGNNLAIKGVVGAAGGGHVVTSSVEHPAVLEACRSVEESGTSVSYLPVDSLGRVSPDDVRGALTPQTVLVSIMWVNNETGVVQPIEEISRITREAGVLFHTDAVQAFGRLEVDVRRVPVDLLTLSGHKFCAPKGAGALYVRRAVALAPTTHGGGQERRIRSGTENLPGIVAMAAAARLAVEELDTEAVRIAALRDRFEREVIERIPDVLVNGGGARRVANTSNLRFAGADGEAVLVALDQQRIAASSASACAASHSEPSYVLMAMGLGRREAEDSMRFSLGRFSTDDDIDRCLDALPGVVERIRSLAPGGTRGKENKR